MIRHPNRAAEEKLRRRCKITVILCMITVTRAPGMSVVDASAERVPYTIVDTAQIRCYNNIAEIEFPKAETEFFGQDAQYVGNEPAYKDNGDGTVTDLNTKLMWQSDPGEKMTFSQA
ncbi:MAG: hypothetical protein JSU94_04915, partial [Phycisphaerales bacterium]